MREVTRWVHSGPHIRYSCKCIAHPGLVSDEGTFSDHAYIRFRLSSKRVTQVCRSPLKGSVRFSRWVITKLDRGIAEESDMVEGWNLASDETRSLDARHSKRH